MASQNLTATRVKPQTSELLTLHVLRRERISPSFVRVTLGGGDAERFVPMGFDQWFRLFIPVSREAEEVLDRLPDKLDTLSYARYLMIAKVRWPVLRSYSVRGYRPTGAEGPEIDVDVVLHGSVEDGTAGPASAWAQTCAVGDAVAILDEGIGFNPPPALARHVFLVADESGVPAAASVLASLPRDAVGHVVVEVPSNADRQRLDMPDGIDVTWLARDDVGVVPGRAALGFARSLPLPSEPFYGWVVGEQNLPVSLRRDWVRRGVPKEHVMFCGYCRHGRAH